MKTKFFVLLVLFQLGATFIFAQKTESRKIQPFSELELSGVFNVHLSQGSSESLKIVAPEDVMDYIISKNDGDRLIVKTKDNWGSKKNKKVEIYITFKEVNRIKNSSVGNLKSEGTLKFDQLDFDNSSVGNTDLTLDANSIEAQISTVGNTKLSGAVKKMNIENKSVGSLKASDLKVDHLTIKNNAVGNTEVYAEKELSIENTGIGSLLYKGNAMIKQLDSSGIGKIKKM